MRPPYGPPSIANVFLKDDGSVVCRGCTTAPAVSEVGILLEALLPEGSSRVPGGLRYTIARSLLNVDVPPFDSLDALSRDLARHERGDRVEAVRRVLQRVDAPVAVAITDRRRGQVSACELHRALREAEVRLFETQRLAPGGRVIELVPPAPPAAAPAREHTLTAPAACLAAGLALIGAGELMHARRVPAVAMPSARVAAHTAVSDLARVRPARGTIVVRAIAPARSKVEGSRPPRPARRVVSLKRSRRFDTAQARPFDRKPAPRGVMDRLKLGWLRRVFTVHSDL